jgi:hypothetical protein
MPMSGTQALRFIERHGLVLQSAHVAGIPTLTDAIAEEPIKGSWWGHPAGRAIFAALTTVYDSPDVLAFRLVRDKLTLVHRRMWPSLVRLSARIGTRRLAAVGEEHTASGAHRSTRIPFPQWVPTEISKKAKKLTVEDALVLLDEFVRREVLRG